MALRERQGRRAWIWAARAAIPVCAAMLHAQFPSAPAPMPVPMPEIRPEPMPMPERPDLIVQDVNKPLAELEDELAQAEAAHDDGKTSQCLIALAIRYSDLGRDQEALACVERALPLLEKSGERSFQALALCVQGEIYDNLGRKQTALAKLAAARDMAREAGDKQLAAQALNRMGMVLYTMGEPDRALEEFKLAWSSWNYRPSARQIEAETLDGAGLVRYSQGDEEKALDDLNQAMELQLGAGDRRGQAASLTGMGLVYTYLGQQEHALKSFNQAMAIEAELHDRRAQATALNNIGWAYDALGNRKRALESLNQALEMQEAVHDIAGQGYTLDSLGLVYLHMGEVEKAEKAYARALPLERQAGDRDCEANSLWGMGDAQRALGRNGDALRDELAALSLAGAVRDSDLQGRVDTSLMRHFRAQHRIQPAILFGTDAVNHFQEARRNISGLGRDVEAGFVQSKSQSYRELAELLVEENRLNEAERVLDLLKEQELKEVVRGAILRSGSSTAPLKLNVTDAKARDSLARPEKTAEGLTSESIEYASLVDKENPTDAEKARCKALQDQIEKGNAEIEDFFDHTLYPQLARKEGVEAANQSSQEESYERSGLQEALRSLGSDVLGIQLLMGEEHVYALLITAQASKEVELAIAPAALRDKVLAVREQLRSPDSDPRAQLEQLYQTVIAPLQPELTDLEKYAQPGGPAPTLLWSLDGVMRYLPMAALYDGQHYFAERFNNVLVTPESYGYFDQPAGNGALRVLAMGLTKSYGGLPALPGVLPELEAVAHDAAVPGSHGPLDGRLLPDNGFTLDAMRESLGTGKRYSVVHIASHFVENTSDGQEPYLMMAGDSEPSAGGFALTLSELQTSTLTFHGVRLLTLSACSTAVGDTRTDGREVESLGMTAQGKGAQAVLDTLWNVNDASTSLLMSDFYARWAAHPAMGKAEALRQAQIALIRSSASQGNEPDRGFAKARGASSVSPIPGYAHPFYWAPFVLVGDFR